MRITRSVALALTIAAGACAGPGLPPGGPGPGEVDVGYGTQDEEDVTGAVTSVSEAEIDAAQPLPIDELLRGRVPGLQVIQRPDGSASYRLRGTNSMLNDQEPLFVIDGVPISPANVQAALASLVPEDIRQVDVLKDVSSTSIFGSRAAGGVIVITTRH